MIHNKIRLTIRRIYLLIYDQNLNLITMLFTMKKFHVIYLAGHFSFDLSVHKIFIHALYYV